MKKKLLYWLPFGVLSALLLFTFVKFGMHMIHVELGKGQVEMFYRMKADALQSDSVERMIFCLDFIHTCYPSGTKQTKGTRMDSIVENVRTEVMGDIVSALRMKTGEDYGDDPVKWIKVYLKRPA